MVLLALLRLFWLGLCKDPRLTLRDPCRSRLVKGVVYPSAAERHVVRDIEDHGQDEHLLSASDTFLYGGSFCVERLLTPGKWYARQLPGCGGYRKLALLVPNPTSVDGIDRLPPTALRFLGCGHIQICALALGSPWLDVPLS